MIDSVTQTPAKGGSAPLISVVLPVYNGGRYLAEAIDSILAQTFSDFELIIIDDGSTDGSLSIIQKYAQKDTRIRVIARENRGLATTLNESIDIARGEWIARMDADDIALPHRFDRQLAWLKETGADISGSWVKNFGSLDQRVVKLRQTDEAIKMEMLFACPLAHPAVMMSTALVKKLRYDKAWEKAEDYDLWERAAVAGCKMTNVPEVLLKYRIHQAQVSTSASVRQKQLSQQIQRRYWKHISETMQLDQRWIEQILKIRESSASHIDLNLVDEALVGLFRRSHGEARVVVWDHALKLYLRVATNCPDIISRWNKLCQNLGGRSSFSTKAELWLLHHLGIRSNDRLFALLRDLHISILRNYFVTIKSNSGINVVFFHRKPDSTNYSVEGTFRVIRSVMPKEIECVHAVSKFKSKGLLSRIYNIFEAAFKQGDVNHITGDVHFLSYLLRRDNTLLTILDCVFIYNTTGIRRYLLRLFWYVIPEKRVALISVISQSTKVELLNCIKCDPNKIRVVPVCISPAFTPFEKKFDVVKPTILQIGTTKNKNLLRLIEAIQGISCKLEIIGKLSIEQVATLANFKIDYSNYFNLSEVEIVARYHRCDLVAFVSMYEGFGMPILEANAVGRPIITSNILSMPEVAGDAACIVDPYNVAEIRGGIMRIINDEAYREILINNGFINKLRFDPHTIAGQYAQLYREISKR
jgi:glycosyltransferase involved in cell wall biosynthesis